MNNKQKKILQILLYPLNIIAPFFVSYCTHLGYAWYLSPIIVYIGLFVKM